MSYHQWDYGNAAPLCSTKYLWDPLRKLTGSISAGTRVLDVGCGNGDIAGRFIALGCKVVGIDLSENGVELARRAHPEGRFEVLMADETLLDRLAEPAFDVVISTEVVEHLYAPKAYAKGCFDAVRPGGRFICSTPYHGYLKNLLIAAINGFDVHVSPMWDGGHVKFWSQKTLGDLLISTGFRNIQFAGAGRLPWLWKSMLMSGDKPL